jgi:hypothetical protein
MMVLPPIGQIKLNKSLEKISTTFNLKNTAKMGR